jgi:hypothetical protein
MGKIPQKIWPRRWGIFFSTLLLQFFPRQALAGMPSLQFTDIAKMRVETMSFFLGVFLLSAWVIKLVWNGLRRDFTKLPWLSYRRALMVTGLWAFLFILILTMISGARELMTPGAWEKNGATYRIRESPGRILVSHESLAKESESRLNELKTALWNYANSHDGRFPSDDNATDIPRQLWETPDPSRVRYLYVGGLKIETLSRPLVYEPALISSSPLVLFTDGQIRRVDVKELGEVLDRIKTP